MPTQPSGLAFKYGVGNQTAEGSALAQPTWDIPYWSGSLVPNQDVADFEVNSTQIVRPGRFKSRAAWGTDGLVVAALPESGPVFWKSLLGSDTITGTSPKVHTSTIVDPNPIWTAMFAQFPAPSGGSVTNMRFEDGVVSAMEVQFAAGQPVKYGVEASGKTVTVDTPGTWTPTNTETYTTAGPYLSSVEPTLKMHATSSTPTTRTNILSGSVRIERAVTWDATTLITPSYRSQSLITATVSLSVEFDTDYDDFWRATFFGSASGTTLSVILADGSLDFLFQQGPTTGSKNCQIVLQSVQWQASNPVMDPSGGPLRCTIEGQMVAPASGEPITVVCQNAQAT